MVIALHHLREIVGGPGPGDACGGGGGRDGPGGGQGLGVEGQLAGEVIVRVGDLMMKREGKRMG